MNNIKSVAIKALGILGMAVIALYGFIFFTGWF